MLVALVRRSRWFFWPAAVALVLAAGSGYALAKPEKMFQKNEVEEPFRRLEQDINRYFAGEKQAASPDDKEGREAAKVAARWFVGRLDWWDVQVGNRELLPTIVRDFKNNYMAYSLRDRDKNKVFMQMFNQEMIALLKILLAKDFNTYKIAQINAGVMLPALAAYGDEDFGNYLAEMVKDTKLHDALKLYALKGLRQFFAVRPPQVDIAEAAVGKVDAARVEVVLAFLSRETPKEASAEEVEATRFIRREAIKALAQTHIPATLVDKNVVKVPVAQGLLRVLAAERNDLAPLPSLTEKAEAAIGLCRIQPTAIEQYQPEASVYLVGKFLLDFAREYRKDEPNFGGKADRPPLLPWKSYADRLQKALKAMQEAKGPPPDAAYKEKLKKLVEYSFPLLELMKHHQPIDDPTVLEGALAKMWPMTPAMTLYQGVADVRILLPALKESP